MLNLMRMLLSGKGGTDPRDLQLDDLHEGWQVGFGFMAQSGLSGRRFTVSELRRYRFDGDNYTAYVLEDNDYKVQIVPARDDEGIPYIAISRLIEISELAQIVDTDALNDSIDVAEDAAVLLDSNLRALRGWVDSGAEYSRALKKVEGTVSGTGADSLFGRKEKHSGQRRISYSLFVNAKGTHALEVEQLANGRKQVYATVYRPATDIGQIARPNHGTYTETQSKKYTSPYLREVPLTLGNNVKQEENDRLVHTPPTLKGAEEPAVEEVAVKEKKVASDPIKVSSASTHLEIVDSVVQKEEDNSEGDETEEFDEETEDSADVDTVEAEDSEDETSPDEEMEEESFAADEDDIDNDIEEFDSIEDDAEEEEGDESADEPSDTGAVVLIPAADEGKAEVLLPRQPEAQMVNCNMNVAGKVIAEAKHSGLTLTQVVRKVMDLPAVMDETVQLRLKLTEGDRRELAKRYGIDSEDPKAVADIINKELKMFAGEDA